MKNIWTLLLAFLLVLVSCGEEDSSTSPEGTSSEDSSSSSEEPSGEISFNDVEVVPGAGTWTLSGSVESLNPIAEISVTLLSGEGEAVIYEPSVDDIVAQSQNLEMELTEFYLGNPPEEAEAWQNLALELNITCNGLFQLEIEVEDDEGFSESETIDIEMVGRFDCEESQYLAE
jgi:hypothetical protein